MKIPPTNFTVLVTGGRDHKYEDELYQEQIFFYLDLLNSLCPIRYLVEGGARGVDTVACRWRQSHTNGKTVPADWKEYGRAAGMIRNKKMLDEFHPQLVVAFPGGKGTEGMVGLANKAHVPVVRVEFEDTWERWDGRKSAIVAMGKSWKPAETQGNNISSSQPTAQ